MNLRSRFVLTAILLLALAAAPALAQTKSTKTATKQAAAAQYSVKPSPEMARLTKMLLGTWDHSDKFPPSAFLPKGGSAHGIESFRLGPGGLFLLADYSAQGSLGPFQGHAVLNWNDTSKTYNAFWIDSTASNPLTMNGGWEGDNLVFTGQYEMMGKKTAIKWIYRDIKPDSFVFEEQSTAEGAAPSTDMVIQYRKAGASKATTSAPKKQG